MNWRRLLAWALPTVIFVCGIVFSSEWAKDSHLTFLISITVGIPIGLTAYYLSHGGLDDE